MQASLIKIAVMIAVLSGCAAESSIKPAEVLDERTGVTVGALQEPLEFVVDPQGLAQSPITVGSKRATFAYLGPIEWDRMGEISYALWIDVAPGNDRPVGNIRTPGAVTLNFTEGPLVLSPIEAPSMGQGPYRSAVSWGQTAYFALDVALLKRMAGEPKLTLQIQAADGTLLEFLPSQDTRATLTKFTQARGITDD